MARPCLWMILRPPRLCFSIAQLKKNHVYYDLGDRPVSTVPEINAARLHLEELWQKTDEINYAAKQPEQWQEISDYMTLLIKGGGKKIDDADEDNGIEVPKDETPAYLEWVLWRAALAFGNLVNHPSDMRGFRLDSDFLPVSAAGGGQGDLYCEYDKFTILTEVTMSTGSRQESMEGEPVRRMGKTTFQCTDCSSQSRSTPTLLKLSATAYGMQKAMSSND